MIDDLIFDVGMNTGEDTAFYLKKGYRVVAIEANPLQVEAARRRFASSVSEARLRLLNIGIGNAPGICPFYVNETHHEWSSLIRELGARGGKFHEIEVEVVTLDSVLREHGIPYYLKIDIEGMDTAAVAAIGAFEDKPRYVSVESGAGPEWLDCLHHLSYRWFKMVGQGGVDQIRCPRPALEGEFVDHRFQLGSSGPFGEETPGPWLNWEEARKAWLDRLTQWQPGQDLWFDIHAKVD